MDAFDQTAERRAREMRAWPESSDDPDGARRFRTALRIIARMAYRDGAMAQALKDAPLNDGVVPANICPWVDHLSIKPGEWAATDFGGAVTAVRVEEIVETEAQSQTKVMVRVKGPGINGQMIDRVLDAGWLIPVKES